MTHETKVEKTSFIPGGFAGTGPNGKFFEAPAWVDKDKPPGITSQEKSYTPSGWWIKLVTGKFLFYSGNLIWIAMALFVYFVFPYDLKAAKDFQNLNWILYRYELHV